MFNFIKNLYIQVTFKIRSTIIAPKQTFLRARDVAEDEHANENNNDMEDSKDLVSEDDLDMTM